jgi:hypothetical protein
MTPGNAITPITKAEKTKLRRSGVEFIFGYLLCAQGFTGVYQSPVKPEHAILKSFYGAKGLTAILALPPSSSDRACI